MRNSTLRIVHGVRTAIYLSLFIAVIMLQLQEWGYCNSPAIEVEDPQPESEDFWPPDMVPHPGRPGEGPEKNEGDWA